MGEVIRCSNRMERNEYARIGWDGLGGCSKRRERRGREKWQEGSAWGRLEGNPKGSVTQDFLQLHIWSEEYSEGREGSFS